MPFLCRTAYPASLTFVSYRVSEADKTNVCTICTYIHIGFVAIVHNRILVLSRVGIN